MNKILAEKLITYGDDFVPYLKLRAMVSLERHASIKALKFKNFIGVSLYYDQLQQLGADEDWLTNAETMNWIKVDYDYSGSPNPIPVYLGEILPAGQSSWFIDPFKEVTTKVKSKVFKKSDKQSDILKVLASLPEIIGSKPMDYKAGYNYNIVYYKLVESLLKRHSPKEIKLILSKAVNSWNDVGLGKMPEKSNYRAILSKKVWPLLVAFYTTPTKVNTLNRYQEHDNPFD